MDQVPLVAGQMEDGQRLLAQLVQEGVPVMAAAWVKEDEGSTWFLYLVTPLVSEDGDTGPAYRRINKVLRQIPQPFWIHPLEYKVFAPNEPVGKAILDLHRQYPGLFPRWYRGGRLGDTPIEAAYIYPPVPAPAARAGS